MCKCPTTSHPGRQVCEVAPNRGGEEVTIGGGEKVTIGGGDHR